MGYSVVQAGVLTACDEQKLVGQELRSHLMREVTSKVLLRQARDVVLLTGPTGAGKERISATIHQAARSFLGRRGDLIELNCANLGGSLFESELFGYKRGAFTGADREHAGLVTRAQGGTLVLDEIQALEPLNQARLLRFLGEREYRAVGDERMRLSDALIILVSNRNLRDMVEQGTFRRDLLDRAGAKIHIPSLHERKQDIGELAQCFALEAGVEASGAVGALDGTMHPFCGLTRRARADIETAVVCTREVSVRRLREVVRDAVFEAAADALPEALDSEMMLPHLKRAFGFCLHDRDREDVRDLNDNFDTIANRVQLEVVAQRQGVSTNTIAALCRAVRSALSDMEADGTPRTYRNLVERLNRLSKAAVWVVAGATTQVGFRRFFGELEHEMPPKSVAHQIYHQVFSAGAATCVAGLFPASSTNDDFNVPSARKKCDELVASLCGGNE